MSTRALLLLLLLVSCLARSDDTAERARFHWIMNCQGCHKADASGSDDGAPNMSGTMARFLAVPGGREYLSRVPGVAFAPLSDEDLAALLNWCLRNFDAEHVPEDFRPYAAAEVGGLRRQPLVSDAKGRRTELVSKFASQ